MAKLCELQYNNGDKMKTLYIATSADSSILKTETHPPHPVADEFPDFSPEMIPRKTPTSAVRCRGRAAWGVRKNSKRSHATFREQLAGRSGRFTRFTIPPSGTPKHRADRYH